MATGRAISRCRPAVRGFFLSISQSARRLNTIAAVRANTMHSRISPEDPPPRPAVPRPRASSPTRTAARTACARSG